MKHPKDIIGSHPQVYEYSCAAWGLEAIVKIHDKPLKSASPFQDQCKQGCGFDDRFLQEMKSVGITTRTHAYKENLGVFENDARAKIQKGYFPLLTVPSVVAVDWSAGRLRIGIHTFVVCEEGGSLRYLTRAHGSNSVYEVTQKQMADLHDRWVKSPLIFRSKDNLANALFHQACSG